tara:strand:- start:537 stop:806 length:270 start_codon:yes stop_codon:yes gene_type:complete
MIGHWICESKLCTQQTLAPGADVDKVRAMIFYKAAFAWLAVSAVLGWSIYQTVRPENPTWTPFFVVLFLFCVLVAYTGCKVDEPDPDHH